MGLGSTWRGRPSRCHRLYRRFILKNFGGLQNFIIWMSALLITIYLVDNFLLGPSQIHTAVTSETPVKKKSEEVIAAPKAKLEEKPVEVPKDAPKSQNLCGLSEKCPAGKYAYQLISGVGVDGMAVVCFNGDYAISAEKGNSFRGLNIAVVNDETKKVESVHSFDTYVSDTTLVDFLKTSVTGSKIILVASQDEATLGLKTDAKTWLHHHGSSAIDGLNFRDSFVMAGQRGLTHGSAIEKIVRRDRNEKFALAAEISGCLAVPMGKLTPVEGIGVKPEDDDDKKDKAAVKYGQTLANCGVKSACDPESFSVHLYTGNGNTDMPMICVNGKYVMTKALNDAGRGFNMAIVNPVTKDILRVGHFDTYAADSSNLEIFLEMLNEGDIILVVVHDDASKNLNLHVRKLLEEVGASMLEKLSFRDVWMFVGQKGIQGHSPIEEIEFAGTGNKWPIPIDKKMCIPSKIKGTLIKPDPFVNKNAKRRYFCKKFDGYGDFCEIQHIDELLTPAPLTDKSLENSPIFKVPIIVLPGLNHNSVRLQLETLLLNPGIKCEMVTVMCDVKFTEPCVLAEVFDFKTYNLNSSNKYVYQVEKGLSQVWNLYPKAKHVIVLEEEVIVGQDFLSFLAQCLPAVEADDTLAGISGWNDNGYKEVSSLTSMVYRANTMPGYGFLLKRKFYEKKMKPDMAACCYKRAWDGWFKDQDVEMVVPDTSRVYRRPYEGLSENAAFLNELFNRPRNINHASSVKIENADTLTYDDYTAHMNKILKSATPLDTSNAGDCLRGNGLGFYIPETSGKAFIIYFEQADKSDQRILTLLCKCFKLFHVENFSVRGLHKGSLRFSYKGNTVILVGSSSPYYSLKPWTHSAISVKAL